MAYQKKYEDTYLDKEGEDEENHRKANDPIMQLVAKAMEYEASGNIGQAVESWAGVAELSQAAGNKDLYYRAVDKMTELGG